jgi:hypothetical protein
MFHDYLSGEDFHWRRDVLSQLLYLHISPYRHLSENVGTRGTGLYKIGSRLTRCQPNLSVNHGSRQGG